MALIGLLMLVIGTGLGLAVYRFMLLPAPEPTTSLPTTTKPEDKVLVDFERNRRNVDDDPAGYLKEVPEARDAEDYYLLGRANILIGDYPKAHEALVEAQKLLADSQADDPNLKVMKNDIAVALVITNDPTFQARLKKDLAPANKPVNANTNSRPAEAPIANANLNR